jgi:hypothetical protein
MEYILFIATCLFYLVFSVFYLFIFYKIDLIHNEVLKMFLIEFLLFLLFYYQSLNSIVLSLLNELLNLFKIQFFKIDKSNDEDLKVELLRVLENKDSLLGEFELFLISCSKINDLMCYFDILDFDNLNEFHARKAVSLNIFYDYLNGFQSNYLVDIDLKYSSLIKEKIVDPQKFDFFFNNVMDQKLFFDTRNFVFLNLLDSFKHFKNSFSFLVFLKKKTEVSLLKNSDF